MATDDSSVLRFQSGRRQRAIEIEQLAGDLGQAINLVKCQLHCAAWTLGDAQSRGDEDHSSQASIAVYACVESLADIEESFGLFRMKLREAEASHG
jgi:hypothetical protein